MRRACSRGAADRDSPVVAANKRTHTQTHRYRRLQYVRSLSDAATLMNYLKVLLKAVSILYRRRTCRWFRSSAVVADKSDEYNDGDGQETGDNSCNIRQRRSTRERQSTLVFVRRCNDNMLIIGWLLSDNSLIHSFIHSFVHSFIHSFSQSVIQLFIHSLIHSFTHSFIRSFVCSFVRSSVHSFIH